MGKQIAWLGANLNVQSFSCFYCDSPGRKCMGLLGRWSRPFAKTLPLLGATCHRRSKERMVQQAPQRWRVFDVYLATSLSVRKRYGSSISLAHLVIIDERVRAWNHDRSRSWFWQQKYPLCKTHALAWSNASRAEWWFEKAWEWACHWVLQLSCHGSYFVLSTAFLPQPDYFACTYISKELCCCHRVAE